jgi:chromosomal replication initiation ATPase DnaA
MTFTLSSRDIDRCAEIVSEFSKIMDIVNAVSQATGIRAADICGHARPRSVTQARWLVSYIAHVDEGHSLEAIGQVLRKHHTSILHGVQAERARRASCATPTQPLR